MKRDDVKGNVIFFAFLLIPVVWAALLAAPFLSGGIPEILKNLLAAVKSPLDIRWVKDTPKCILLFVGTYGLGIGIYLSTRRNYRPREEHGSARWGYAAVVNRIYRDRHWEQNKVLTQNVRIGFNGRKHRRNLNVMVVGGSGSGKTRFYAKPSAPVRAAH